MAISDDRVTESTISTDPDPFRAMTCALLADPGLERTLDLVVSAALTALPAVTAAGISTLEHDGSLACRAPSDPVVAELDALQSDLGEGPAHECVHSRSRVTADDLALTDPGLWPRFAPVALERRIAAVCSVPLLTPRGTCAALNLYAPVSGAFDRSCLSTAALVASHATVAIGGARRVADLTDAIATRDVIGQAKGILMERKGVDSHRAFDMLVRSSQETNIKVRDVATWLVGESGPQPRPSVENPRRCHGTPGR